VVRINGLPLDVKEEVVLDFFKDFEVKEGTLKLDSVRGSGLIKFANARVAKEAVKALDRTYIGQRWVQLTML